MSAAHAVKQIARIATTTGLAKNVIGFLDRKPSLLSKRVTSQELTIIYDRLRHTLELIPLSTNESHPKLFRVRQDILKQMEVLTSLIVEAERKVVRPGSHVETRKRASVAE
jgi:hypothetical protein